MNKHFANDVHYLILYSNSLIWKSLDEKIIVNYWKFSSN
jgi:hypothetical protein